jgi:hypothetical protein
MMMKTLICLLAISSVIIAKPCCNGNLGRPINKIDWTQYVSNVKNQASQKTCWAHATASYLEMKFAELTGINFKLSVRQLVENTYKEVYSHNDLCYVREETNEGGRETCALSYVKARGVMTDRDYMLHGYDIRKTTPIGITSLKYNMNIKTRDELLKYLNVTPFMIFINTDALSDFNNDIRLGVKTDHVVVATNVCQHNDNLFIEFLNSYSSGWGTCGGYGYIRITDNNDLQNLVDNRGSMTHVSYAEVTNLRSILSESCSNRIDYIFGMNIGIIIFIAIIFTFLIVITCYMVYITMKMNSNQ